MPPKVRILADQPRKRNPSKRNILDTIIFISRDPYVKAEKMTTLARNNLQDVIYDTYGEDVKKNARFGISWMRAKRLKARWMTSSSALSQRPKVQKAIWILTKMKNHQHPRR